MAMDSKRAAALMDQLVESVGTSRIAAAQNGLCVAKDHGRPVPGLISWTRKAQQDRLALIQEESGVSLKHLPSLDFDLDPQELRGNIEQYIGMTMVPTGIMGPLLVHGAHARGDFYVPMATTEGALIASYSRGAAAARQSGGITSLCLGESVQRTPVFRFLNLSEAVSFAHWALQQLEQFRAIVGNQSRHARLQELKVNIEGNQVTLVLEFYTGDAAGQNMVTICADAICTHIAASSPVACSAWYVESNASGDKKATVQALGSVRGKKVTAEALIRKDVVERVLNSTAADIAQYWQTSTVGVVQSGAVGDHGHYANGLAAIFMACGQDVACVAEAAIGITRMEARADGDLYLAVTLPGLIVGTVGGGTHLPTQKECLALLGCDGPGTARKFAEICAATVLCGELSIAAALASGTFARAHKMFGRKKDKKSPILT